MSTATKHKKDYSKLVDTSNLSRSAWLRGQVLRKPTATAEEIGEFDGKAVSRQEIFNARTVLKKRWGFDSLDEVPRKGDGDVSVTGLIERYINRTAEPNETDCAKCLWQDGIELRRTGLYGAAWRKLKPHHKKNKKAAEAAAETEVEKKPVEENEEQKPRARFLGKRRKGMNGRRKKNQPEPSDVAALHEEIESTCDDLMRKCEDILGRGQRGEIVRALKDVRRRASAGVLQHSK